jgi:hypothetical protein
MKITRRKLAVALLAPAAVAAQTPPPIPSTPEQELAAMRAQYKLNSQALDQVSVPMSLEPAFQFQA